jgi:hypothetical protein
MARCGRDGVRLLSNIAVLLVFVTQVRAVDKFCVLDTKVQAGGVVSLKGDVIVPVPAKLQTTTDVPLYGDIAIVFPTGGWDGGRAARGCVQGAARGAMHGPASWPAARPRRLPPTAPLIAPHYQRLDLCCRTCCIADKCPVPSELAAALADAFLAEPTGSKSGVHIDRLAGTAEMDGLVLGTIAIQDQQVGGQVQHVSLCAAQSHRHCPRPMRCALAHLLPASVQTRPQASAGQTIHRHFQREPPWTHTRPNFQRAMFSRLPPLAKTAPSNLSCAASPGRAW